MFILKRLEAEILNVWSRTSRVGLRPSFSHDCQPPTGSSTTLKRSGRVVYTARQPGQAFSFDFSFNAYPLSFKRPGPEIVVYRLRGGQCSGRALPSRET